MWADKESILSLNGKTCTCIKPRVQPFCDSNLLSDWVSYLRTDYRDSLTNESHLTCLMQIVWGFGRLEISLSPPVRILWNPLRAVVSLRWKWSPGISRLWDCIWRGAFLKFFVICTVLVNIRIKNSLNNPNTLANLRGFNTYGKGMNTSQRSELGKNLG